MTLEDPIARRRRLKRIYAATYRAKHRALLRTKGRAYVRARRVTDPEGVRERDAEWRKNNPDKVSAKNRRHYVAHQAALVQRARANPVGRAAAVSRYAKRHPERVAIVQQRRYARKRALPAHWNAAAERAMLEYWDFACAACGAQDGFQWRIVGDHWIPLSVPDCPGTVPWNMVPLCHGVGSCNTSKHNRDGAAWLLDRFGARKGRAILKRIEAYLLALRPHDVS